MDDRQFRSLVCQMRALQKLFFRTRAGDRPPDLIRRCKAIEDRVDAEIATDRQPDLFAKETAR